MKLHLIELLPYHCPTLNGNYLRPPCAGQIAAAKKQLAKFPGAMLGFLGKCMECGGKGLVVRAPSTDRSIDLPELPPPEGISEEKQMAGIVVFKSDKEKMTPAVARDLGIEKNKPVIPVQKAKEEQLPENTAVVTYPLSAVIDEIPAPCTRPDCEAPGSLVKIDKLGRSMGMCVKCLSVRGRKSGIESHRLGRTSPPVSIPLNQAEYAELKTWLGAQAKEYERTLQKEIMYRLKMAMRGAS